MKISKVEQNIDGTLDMTIVSEDTGDRFILTGCYPISLDLPGGISTIQQERDVTFRYRWLTRQS